MALSQKGISYDGRNELDPVTRRAVDSVVSQLRAGFLQANITPEGFTPAPAAISKLTVTGQDGIFDVQIQDNSAVKRGIEYFLEYSLTAAFTAPITVSLGPARNWRRNLGNQTLFWRAYSQYPTSDPSPAVYFGTAAVPTAVVGGGATTGPTVQPSTGSGTAPNTGLSGGQGYGSQPSRGPQKF